LQSEGMRQLDQRITIRTTLRPLTLEETSDYIAFRLVKAGKGSAILDEKVKKTIYKISGGIPRLVNLLTSRAMMVAYIGTAHHLQKKHVLDAAKHISNTRTRIISWQKMVAYAVVGLLIVSLIPVSVIMYHTIQDYRNTTIASTKSGMQSESPGDPAAVNTSLPAVKKNEPEQKVSSDIQKKAIVAVYAARLRERPSLQANIERVVTKGESLDITDEWTELSGNKWYKVKTHDGNESWIASYIVRVTSLR